MKVLFMASILIVAGLLGCQATQVKNLHDTLQTLSRYGDKGNVRVRIPLQVEAGLKQAVYTGSGGWVEAEFELKASK